MAEILVVDDDVDVSEIVSEVLQSGGYEVRVAANGEEGLRELSVRLPDLVLLDVEMPILDGPGMAYQMFVHDVGMDEIPIVISSGAPYAPDIAKRIGTPYLIAKPYRQHALYEIVRRALAEQIVPNPGSATANEKGSATPAPCAR